MIDDHALDELVQGRLEIVCLFQFVGELFEYFRHGGVEHGVGFRNGSGRAEHTELEFIARERKGGRTVSVRGVFGEFGQGMHAYAQQFLFFCAVRFVLFDSGKDIREFIAQKHGNNGGRRFVRA